VGNLATKHLAIGLTVLSLVGLAGYEEATRGRLRSLTIKNTSLAIKYVRTEGVFQYLSKNEIQTVLQPLVMASFFDLDMQTIHAVVATLPWVDTVTVKRIWPDAIDIKIYEKKPYARWGVNSLITEQGHIFTPKDIEKFTNMTLVNGPESQELKVLEIMKGIKTALLDQSMSLTEFNINDRGAWQIKLSTGLEIQLGRNEQLKKLQRFLETLAVLKQEQVEQMAVVDLRYPNGYAVSWKPGITEIDWNAIANPDNQLKVHDRAM
jgi:cell division protein FtsQ